MMTAGSMRGYSTYLRDFVEDTGLETAETGGGGEGGEREGGTEKEEEGGEEDEGRDGAVVTAPRLDDVVEVEGIEDPSGKGDVTLT
mmetsp:Transcript_16585/g.30020  ORF Transcript_16585/g.30020 Transcript_16585/m.30020 type:complete len:86 (+) Transcript_16585:872-1129(+)